MNRQTVFAFILPAGLLPLLVVMFHVALLWFIYLTLKKSKQERHALLNSLASLFDERSGEATSKPFVQLTTLRGRYQGRSAFMSAEEGGKNRPSEFHIGIVCRAPIEFKIQVQSGGDKILQALHLQSDVQVGDAELDQKLVFTCKDAERFASWGRRPEVREKLLSLMVAGSLARLHLTKMTLTAAILGYKRYKLTSSDVEVILRNTYALIASLESVFGTTPAGFA